MAVKWDKVRAFVFIGLILTVLAGTLWLDMQSQSDRAMAQESPVETPTPEPTPTRVPRTVNEVVHPQPGDAIAGKTEIIGTALIINFMRYDIHIARAAEDRWSWVTSSSEVVHDDVLHVLNTRGYGDGRYDLRVRAVDMQGNFTEAIVHNLEIRNSRPPTATPDPNITPVPMSPLPTPTPTPDMTARLPGGTGLYAPDFGAVLRGSVDIVGAVGGQYRNPMTRWDVAISSFGEEEWIGIRSGSDQGFGLTLMTLDTTQYEDGLYDLRLRISYQDGNFNDYYLRQLSIANQGDPQFAFMPRPSIIAPGDGETLSDVVTIRGTVPRDDLLHWELAWRRQGDEAWLLWTTGDQPLREGELARVDFSRFPSGVYDGRLRVVRRNVEPQDTFVRNLQVQGMPATPEDEEEILEDDTEEQ